MAIRRAHAVRPPHAVFSMVDMQGGDKNKCWEWQGCCAPNPIFQWRRKRYQAHRMVYSLRTGLHYDDVPKLAWLCGNNKCCNPSHLTPAKGVTKLVSERLCEAV